MAESPSTSVDVWLAWIGIILVMLIMFSAVDLRFDQVVGRLNQIEQRCK